MTKKYKRPILPQGNCICPYCFDTVGLASIDAHHKRYHRDKFDELDSSQNNVISSKDEQN